MTSNRPCSIMQQFMLSKSRKKYLTICFYTIFSTLIGSCNEDDSMRVERIDKLRAIGLASNPVVLSAPVPGSSGTVELTAFAALPAGSTVTATSFLDDASAYAPPVTVVMDSTSESTQQLGALDLYSVKGTVTVGPLTPEQQAILAAPSGKLTLRYGIRLEAGEESEDIVGNILVYPAGSEESAYQTVSVSVAEPVANATIGSGPDQVLSGSITKPQPENIKVSWFVSSGKVTNRRAKETKWEPQSSGTQTVIMTARGMKSGSFALQAVDVTVE